MIILGISAFYHDSAAAIIENGKILAAIQEERISRIKNDSSFPINAIKYILNELCLNENDIDEIIFYDKPLLKFERIIDGTLRYSPYTFKTFLESMPSWLSSKLNFRKLIFNHLKSQYPNLAEKRVLFSDHHFSHAASSFYTSPFTDSAVLTIDGVGEWATTTIYSFSSSGYRKLKEMHYPHSVGLLYSAFTMFCGFKVNSGEYKLMGLAPYGSITDNSTKKFIDLMKENLFLMFHDGSLKLNLSFFNFQRGQETINIKKFEDLFQIKRRNVEEKILQEHCNFALAAQTVIEEIILCICKHTKEITDCKNLCLAGGVALNCVANSKILNSGLFEEIWIPSAPGDSGGAIGCALGYFYKNNKYKPHFFSPYLGHSYTTSQIERTFKRYNIEYVLLDDESLFKKTAKLIQENNIIGWFQGRMEWGPRALGNRSILANPLSKDMQNKLNLKIKFRESFRPFAPVTIEEDIHLNFDTKIPTPFMQFTVPVKNSYLVDKIISNDLQNRLKGISSPLPAITHLDLSARVQSVSEIQNYKMYNLLKEFKNLTGFGVLINTSFNVRGEPIVSSPEDAIECFLSTEIDYLIIENFFIDKRAVTNKKKFMRKFLDD